MTLQILRPGTLRKRCWGFGSALMVRVRAIESCESVERPTPTNRGFVHQTPFLMMAGIGEQRMRFVHTLRRGIAVVVAGSSLKPASPTYIMNTMRPIVLGIAAIIDMINSPPHIINSPASFYQDCHTFQGTLSPPFFRYYQQRHTTERSICLRIREK